MSEFWDKFAEKLKNQLKAQSITAESHPEFHASIKKAADKAGIDMPHILYAEEIPLGPVWTRKLPNGAAIPGSNVVIMNKSMLELSGSSLEKAASPQLEGVILHEFSHLKDGFARNASRMGAVTLLPLVSMAGLYLYDKAKERTKRKKGESEKSYAARLHENVGVVADEEIKAGYATSHVIGNAELHPKWKEAVMKTARYVVAASIGLAAGLGYARYTSLSAEFRADAMAARLGDAEEFKTLLAKLYDAHKNAVKSEKATLEPPLVKIKNWVGKGFVHAHPTLEERLSHVDKVAASKNAGGHSL